jgi:4a-hydroxytetrahydrobiopterin dehydratase
VIKLSDTVIQDTLAQFPAWTEMNGEIQRTYQFSNFAESMHFVITIAEYAEREQHHPDILIRYDKVTLTVSTHDAGGITEKDFALAAAANAAFDN